LLNAQRADVDVLISPHHGSRRANPPELAEWCMPELVVVSQGRPRSGATLNSFRDAGIPVLTTNDCGAITLTVDAERCDATYVQLPTTAN
jgi:competence protein ComEC